MNLRIKDLFLEKNAFALPNLLSLSRLIFIPLIAYFAAQGHSAGDRIAFILIVLGASTDFFDGLIARRFQMQSNLGRILDPIMDKLGIAVLMIIWALYKSLPLWFMGIVIARDVGILLAGIFLLNRRHVLKESNMIGKLAVVLYVLVLIFYLFDLRPFKQIALVLSVIFLLLSMLNYGRIFIQLLRKNET